MKKLLYIIGILTAICFPLAQAQAAVVELNAGPHYESGGTGGSGRGIGFLANQDFTMNAFGIYADLLSLSFDVDIYSSSDGHAANTLLDTFTANLNAQGFGWYDIATDFNFVNGNYYVVNWSPTNNDSSWEGTTDPGIDYYYDTEAPYNFGIITLVEGFEGSFPNSGNPLYPHSRITFNAEQGPVIPEPATMTLFGIGIAGIASRVLRKKA